MENARFYATEYAGRVFDIFEEISDPYDNDKAVGQIELHEAKYIGGELYMIPMQIYQAENPLFLKAVCLISELFEDETGSYTEIRGNNIRTVEITCDGIARYDDNGHRSPETYDLKIRTTKGSNNHEDT